MSEFDDIQALGDFETFDIGNAYIQIHLWQRSPQASICSNVHQLLLKAIQIKFIDEVMVCDLYNTVLDMDEKFTSAFSSKRYKKKMSELGKGCGGDED